MIEHSHVRSTPSVGEIEQVDGSSAMIAMSRAGEHAGGAEPVVATVGIDGQLAERRAPVTLVRIAGHSCETVGAGSLGARPHAAAQDVVHVRASGAESSTDTYCWGSLVGAGATLAAYCHTRGAIVGVPPRRLHETIAGDEEATAVDGEEGRILQQQGRSR